MTRAERALYQQLHPVKLLTDVGTSFASCWLLWEGRWGWAAAVALPPSVLVTAALMWRADLEGYRDSPMGRYLARSMDRRATGIRIGGQLLMWAAAATHLPWAVPLGFAVVVFGWLRGLWQPGAEPPRVPPQVR